MIIIAVMMIIILIGNKQLLYRVFCLCCTKVGLVWEKKLALGWPAGSKTSLICMTLVIIKCKSFQADLLFEVVIYGKPLIFFCTYTIYTFPNKTFTVTSYLYI